MAKFLLRRTANYVILVAVATSAAFMLASVSLKPRANFEGRNPPPPEAVVDARLTELNMNDKTPVLTRYKNWVSGVVHGDFELSSGGHATSYVDLRRVTLDGRLAPLVGRVLLNATADLTYDAVGGLTLGADPVATAMMHAAANRGTPVDAFVVRKAEKAHGLQRRIEGPDVTGRRVLALEDTSTTGNSVLAAVDALEEAGAEVVGVAVIVDRGARQKVLDRGLPYIAVYELDELGG